MRRRIVGVAVAVVTAAALVMGVGALASPASAANGSAPIGSYDTLTRVQGGYDGTGWCYDADAPDVACDVHVYLDGKLVAGTNAGVYRPDVAAALGISDPYHGFHFAYPYSTPGTHSVCVYAINLGAGDVNPLLGCKSFTIPAAAREERAVAWAQAQLGSQSWNSLCDRFVANAFGRVNSGDGSAWLHYQRLLARGTVHVGERSVPRGALAFFGPTSMNHGDGHVMISRGDGTFVSTIDAIKKTPPTVRVVGLSWAENYSGPYLGWSYANSEWAGR